jgi:plastocyanin
MKKASVLLVAIGLALFGLAACGGDDGNDETTAAATTTETTQATDTAAATGGAGAGATLALAAPADGSLAYDTTELTAASGPVTINFDNPAALSHDVAIEDESGSEVGKTDLVSEGQASVTVDLTPGAYTYFCSVPGHREAGMEGTLTVK